MIILANDSNIRSMRSFLMRLALKKNSGILTKLEEFEKTQFYSEAELEYYREEKLRSIVTHAYNTVPFYKDLFDKNKIRPKDIRHVSDLKKMPVITKQIVRDNYKRMLSDSCAGRIRVRQTGGSTGTPLTISYCKNAFFTEVALQYRFLKWLNYEWGDEILMFWGEQVFESAFSKLKSKVGNYLYNRKFVSTFKVDDFSLAAMINNLERRPPKILRGYASSLYLLALKCLELDFKKRLNAVTTTAEKLFDFQRSEIEKAFGPNIFNQYGCDETNSLAHECEQHNGLHVASEHVIIELLGENGSETETGHVVLTNLSNYAMPLIRYKNEDVARWSKKNCTCKRNSPLLEEIEGRVSNFVQGPNGRKVHAEFFTHIFRDMGLFEKCEIKEFRVVQKKVDRLSIEFCTPREINNKDKNTINEKVNEYLGNTEIEIIRVEQIPLTRRGKKLFVLSLLNRDMWN